MIKLKTREDLLKLLPKNIVIAELGIFKGEFSSQIVSNVSPSMFYMVDTFHGHAGSGDKDGNNFCVVNMSEIYKQLTHNYKDYDNVRVIQNFSHIFLENLEDDSLDAIYIDADHSYESVKRELSISLKKVKKDGFIMGHDYENNFHPGTVQAVNEFCISNNLEIKYLTEDVSPSYFIINNRSE